MDGDKTFYIGRRKVTQHEVWSPDTFWEWTVGEYWVAYEVLFKPSLGENRKKVLLIAEPTREEKEEVKRYGDRESCDAWQTGRLRFRYSGYDLDELKAMSLLIKFLDSVKTNKTEGAKDD